MRTHKKNLLNLLSMVCWSLALIGYFFQFPFPKLASLIVPCVFCYIALQLPNWRILKEKKYLFGMGLYIVLLAVAAVRSLAAGVAFERIARFASILILLPICCWVKDPSFKIKNKVFIYLALAKSVLLLGIAVCIAIQGDFTPWRNWALSNGLGDIYFFTRWFPKVQVQGNALLVVAFITDVAQRKRLTVSNVIILGGILAAGNFAYILGIGLFLGWHACIWAVKLLKEGKIQKKTIIAAAVCLAIIISPYIVKKIQEKAEVSNKVRLEQAQVLLDANPVFGEGLGNYIVADTSTRAYNGDIYFELQTLYIYNQVGLLGVLLAYALTFWPLRKKGSRSVILYLIYLIYAFWNPYCWDTTHMITLILITNLDGLGGKYDKSDYYCLLSIGKGKIQHGKHREAG